MTGKLVWIHGDSLSASDAALRANPDSPAVFIFDKDLLERSRLTHKRIQFLYESALDIVAAVPQFEIHTGNLVETLCEVAKEKGATQIHTTRSIAPLQAQHIAELKKTVAVKLYEPEAFVNYNGATPKRFMSFWYKIEKDAMRLP